MLKKLLEIITGDDNVTDGRIQFLGDCTHALVGQTVDLPHFDQLD